MQGKGKKFIGVPQVEVATYGSQGIKKKFVLPSKSITLHYIDAKAVLSLEIGDEKLVKVVVDYFRKADPELCQFSMLNFLRLPKNKADEKAYYHKIDTKEALSLIFHLQEVRKGKIAKIDQQLQDLVTVVNEFQINQNEIDREFADQFEQRRQALNYQVYHCRKAIKTIIQDRITQLKNHFTTSPDYIKLLILQAKTKQLGLDLFQSVVVGLREVSHQQVEIIYEQCYPSRRCSITYLKAKIGEQMYLRKKMDFVRMFSISQKEGLNNTNLIVCHMCKDLLKEEYIRCSEFDMPIINVGYKNSPTIYYKRLVAFDYCYDSYDPPSLDDELDYYKYSQYPLQRRHCSRLFCRQCLNSVSRRDGLQHIIKHKCQVCKLVCVCHSCRLANQIVVGLAIIRDLLTKNHQGAQKYRQIIDYVNFNDCDDSSMRVEPYLRIGFRSTGKQEYLHSYNIQMDRMQQIYRAIEKYRELANASSQELQTPSVILTPEMKHICAFFDEAYSQSESRHRVYSQKRIELKPSIATLTPDNHNHKQKDKPASIKKKYEDNPDLHNTLRKFCIGQDEPVQLPDDWMLEQERQDIENELLRQLEPANESIVGRVGVLKNEVPFEEDDYQKMHVGQQFKLVSERQIQFERLVQAGIFHEVTDPQFSSFKINVLTFFQDINDYFVHDQSEDVQSSNQLNQSPPEASQGQLRGQEKSQLRRVQGEIGSYRQGPLSFNPYKIEEQQVQPQKHIALEDSFPQNMHQCKKEELRGDEWPPRGSGGRANEGGDSSDEIQEIEWHQFMSLTQRGA